MLCQSLRRKLLEVIGSLPVHLGNAHTAMATPRSSSRHGFTWLPSSNLQGLPPSWPTCCLGDTLSALKESTHTIMHSQPLPEFQLLKNSLVNSLLSQHTSAALLQGSAVSKGTARPKLYTAATLSLSQPGLSISRPEVARHP